MIGEPRMFFIQHAGYHRPPYPPDWHWRTDKMMGGGGMIMDRGVHFADTVGYLFGEPMNLRDVEGSLMEELALAGQ